jgi:hypothetical protein
MVVRGRLKGRRLSDAIPIKRAAMVFGTWFACFFGSQYGKLPKSAVVYGWPVPRRAVARQIVSGRWNIPLPLRPWVRGSDAGQIEHGRVLMSLQLASPAIGAGAVSIIVIWAVVLFFGIGLFAESNNLVIAGLIFVALRVAFAVFLMLELNSPYIGLFRVNPAALEQAIANIDK